jgi:hypothetical protein
VADLYEQIYQFEISGNYHEYTYGPVFDKNGDMLVTLNMKKQLLTPIVPWIKILKLYF